MNQQQQNIHHTEDLIREKQKELHKLYDKLTRMRRTTRLTLSDHAIVRYQERVALLPTADVWAALITPKLVVYYHQMGDGTYPVNDTHLRVVIKDAVIVTVLT